MIQKILLPWNQWLLDAAADRFRSLIPPADTVADASSFLLIVQTAEAGRRLSEAIVERFPHGIHALNIVQPAFLTTSNEQTASPSQVLLHWMRTLQTADFSRYPNLFKNSTAIHSFSQNQSWLAETAQRFQDFREQLFGEGFTAETAAEKNGDPDSIFYDFALLEKRYLSSYNETDQIDPVLAKIHRIQSLSVSGINHIIFLNCTDPLPAACIAAHQIEEQGVTVESWIAAKNESMLEHFDEFGNPDPAFWNNPDTNILDIPIFTSGTNPSNIRKFVNPNSEALELVRLCSSEHSNRPSVIASFDPDVTESFRREILRTGNFSDFYIPEETPLSKTGIAKLILALLRFAAAKDPSIEDCYELLRNPDIMRSLGVIPEEREQFLSNLFDFTNEFLVRDFDRLIETPKLRKSILEKKQFQNFFEKKELENLTRFIPVMDAFFNFHKVLFHSEKPLDDVLLFLENNRIRLIPPERTSASDLSHAVICAAAEIQSLDGLSKSELVLLLKKCMDTAKLKTWANDAAKTDLADILELPWTREPVLLMAGANEEYLTQPPETGMFLPDNIRTKLKMRDHAHYNARTAYLLRLLIEMRKPLENAGLIFLFAQTSRAGDWLKPAHVFFQCPLAILPQKIDLLFGGKMIMPADKTPETQKSEIKLRIPPYTEDLPQITSMSPSDFELFLHEPLAFYLKKVYNDNFSEPELDEMSSMVLGNVIHDVLRRYKTGWDEAKIFSTLKMVFYDAGIPYQSGIPMVQTSDAADRLRAFLSVQMKEENAGWGIMFQEISFRFRWGDLYERVFPNEANNSWRDISIGGKCDRIDFNEQDKCWRLIDYKTGKKTPEDKHLAALGSTDDPNYAAAGFDRPQRWVDLQLPLYALALRFGFIGSLPPELCHKKIRTAYFTIPSVLTEISLKYFNAVEMPETETDELPDTLLSAVRCADSVLQKVASHSEKVFYPSDRPVSDPFSNLVSLIGKYSKETFAEPEKDGAKND